MRHKTLFHTFRLTFFCITVGTILAACSPAQKSQKIKDEVDSVNATSTNIEPYLTRDIQDEIFYFVMPDRFHNAKPSNDNGDPNRPISFGGLDKNSKWAFHGGDIAGVEAKLDYIQGLGVSSIWMTPILRNRAIQPDGFGHHGYWVVDFTEIDPHFGSNDDLKSLIAAAHARDMKVFFDIITNHTADVIKYEECHMPSGEFLEENQKACAFISSAELAEGKKYTPFVREDEKNVKVPAWLNDPKYYNNQGDSFWQGESAIKGDFVGLDDIDTSQPEVIDGLTEVFKDLISEFKPDGFRIDTVKHVDIEFWQAFGPAITEHAKKLGIPEFFIFGEVYDGNPAGLSKYTTVGKLPSVLDFGFAFNVKDVLMNNKSLSQLSSLFDNDDYYRDADSSPNDLLNFLGNHDMGRVGHFIQQGLPDIDEQEMLQRSKLGHALMFFSRGVPVVYYGDEQGFTGDGGDVDARENMDPSQVAVYNDNNLIGTKQTTADDNFNTQHPLYLSIANLAKIRNSYPSLRHGEHINRAVDENKRVYAFSRVMPSLMQDLLVVFNLSTHAQQFEISAEQKSYKYVAGEGKVKKIDDTLQFDMPGLSYSLFESIEPISYSTISKVEIQASYEENDRVFIPVDITFDKPERFNLAKLTFFGVRANGEETQIATDTTFPYRAALMPELLSEFIDVRVVATNYREQSKEHTARLIN
ncbi:alpha-amylase family glycosyl hydrolase [Glaciecola petra]|uniref:Alpha-amylase n=1 Tax=Glaciecola petra TaxID=3075602 RepID=A0ABU2ZV01_9ALTE|nr:alpha-amylase family glycosyl hydrolase [Aestuariibacter sp. P117]MDT0596225.1 alpha-amylase family glycosyl hydrolase [Aestuariibacter sp. P117]